MTMTKAERTVNLIAVVLPFVAFVAAIVLLWNSLVGWTDLVAFAVMYLIAGFGVTVGFHRLLTHRAFQTHKPIEYGFAVLGSLAVAFASWYLVEAPWLRLKKRLERSRIVEEPVDEDRVIVLPDDDPIDATPRPQRDPQAVAAE